MNSFPPKLHKESFNRRCSRESHSLTSETGSTWTTSWPILWGKQDRVAGHCAHSNPWLLDSSPTDTAWFWNNLTRETHSILKSTKILCISGRIIYSLFIYIYILHQISQGWYVHNMYFFGENHKRSLLIALRSQETLAPGDALVEQAATMLLGGVEGGFVLRYILCVCVCCLVVVVADFLSKIS